MLKKLIVAGLLASSFHAIANNISLEQVTKDVSFLADDKLSGRASFTPESELAANYIANRFADLGLHPLEGNAGFKQIFPLFQIQTETINVKLDGSKIDDKNVLILSAYQTISWNIKNPAKILKINANDDFSERMQAFNQLSEDILILVDQKHNEIFSRYHEYFSQPRNKFKINTGPSAVIVLTSHSDVLEYDVDIEAKIQQQSLTNVIGVLPGIKKKDEMILFSAHYDHLGLKTPQTETEKDEKIDLIYNGADDDASGTSAVINLAEYFSNNKNNQRSIVFVAFAAEELGGFGSRYFSENINPEKISAMLNIEMIGKPSKFGSGQFWMTGFERSDLATILNKNLSALGKQVHPDPYPEQQLFYRSDNATLARLGVPAHSLSSTQIDNDHHYHKTSDSVETLDLKSMSAVIQTIAESVKTLVDASDTPTRIDTLQIKKNGNYF